MVIQCMKYNVYPGTHDKDGARLCVGVVVVVGVVVGVVVVFHTLQFNHAVQSRSSIY